MEHKIALITGANSGIGLATAKALARQSFDLILLCRNKQKGLAAQQEIKQTAPGTHVELLETDLGNAESIRQAADFIKTHYTHLDVLIANAGYSPTQLEFTPDGIEQSFYDSHIGHFRLVYYLTDLLRKTAAQTGDVRIISLSSAAHMMGQKARFFRHIDNLSLLSAYGDDKLANLLFAKGVAHQFAGTGIRAYSVHPGVVRTNFGAGLQGLMGVALKLASPFMRSPEKGAQTSIFLATAPLQAIGEQHNGAYFVDSKPKTTRNPDVTDANANWLWEQTLRYV